MTNNQNQTNFRFRSGLFGKLVLQKKVVTAVYPTKTYFVWVDATVSDLEEYYRVANENNERIDPYAR